ncbi:MAG: AarF/ABC1/UbiB kinase family protein [Halieaceae bacterium]|nr:AarF/ABC1/UbiB kinase family protein [Halieaceae bacterium]
MAKSQQQKSQQAAVPSTRIGRFARVAKLAGGVATGMIAEGGRRLRSGERPRARDMLLTPRNAQRVADELARMRGAAMKLGQMLSMDGGEFLPRQLADILARLRDEADYMPFEQLDRTMTAAFGEDWEEQFYGFDYQPIAAASIGQVHRTHAPDGRDIVLKVQYPGVAKSIDSDIDNIAALLKLSGLVPDQIDMKPLLKDAKAQLRDEANYLLEAEHLAEFGALLADDERFVVPELLPELTTEHVLAMTYIDSEPVDVISELGQQQRDALVTAMMDLMLMEFFHLRMVQTDPNFANYRYQSSTERMVLLDFGATRRFKAKFVNEYRRMIKAAQKGDEDRLLNAAEKLGYVVEDGSDAYRQFVLDIFAIALEPLTTDGPYDFGSSDISSRLSEIGASAQDFREFWHAPPSDAVFFHRKVGGMFLLAQRMGARVDLKSLAARWV